MPITTSAEPVAITLYELSSYRTVQSYINESMLIEQAWNHYTAQEIEAELASIRNSMQSDPAYSKPVALKIPDQAGFKPKFDSIVLSHKWKTASSLSSADLDLCADITIKTSKSLQTLHRLKKEGFSLMTDGCTSSVDPSRLSYPARISIYKKIKSPLDKVFTDYSSG